MVTSIHTINRIVNAMAGPITVAATRFVKIHHPNRSQSIMGMMIIEPAMIAPLFISFTTFNRKKTDSITVDSFRNLVKCMVM